MVNRSEMRDKRNSYTFENSKKANRNQANYNSGQGAGKAVNRVSLDLNPGALHNMDR